MIVVRGPIPIHYVYQAFMRYANSVGRFKHYNRGFACFRGYIAYSSASSSDYCYSLIPQPAILRSTNLGPIGPNFMARPLHCNRAG